MGFGDGRTFKKLVRAKRWKRKVAEEVFVYGITWGCPWGVFKQKNCGSYHNSKFFHGHQRGHEIWEIIGVIRKVNNCSRVLSEREGVKKCIGRERERERERRLRRGEAINLWRELGWRELGLVCWERHMASHAYLLYTTPKRGSLSHVQPLGNKTREPHYKCPHMTSH